MFFFSILYLFSYPDDQEDYQDGVRDNEFESDSEREQGADEEEDPSAPIEDSDDDD